MFLGTPRRWWIAAALTLVPGLVLVASGGGGALGMVGGVALVLLGLALFAAAPMRSGRSARTPPAGRPAPPAATEPARPRPKIEAGDPSEV